jgi:hypothetical protein
MEHREEKKGQDEARTTAIRARDAQDAGANLDAIAVRENAAAAPKHAVDMRRLGKAVERRLKQSPKQKLSCNARLVMARTGAGRG